MFQLTIYVTEEDIQKGTPGSCRNCAVALAATRALKELGTRGTASLLPGVSLTIRDELDAFIGAAWTIPDHVEAFARKFDRGECVWPFNFDIKVHT